MIWTAGKWFVVLTPICLEWVALTRQGEKKKMIMKLKEQLADAQHVRNA